MSLVSGKDMILYVFENNTFIPIACSRTCVFTTVTETAGKSTIGSGLFRENKGIVNSGSLSSEGVVSFDDNMSVSNVRLRQFALSSVFFQFRVVDEGGEGVVYSGSMILTSVAETGNYNDIGTYSVQAITTGQIEITSTVGNPGIIYFNTQDDFENPTDFTRFITANPDDDIIINYGHENEALYYWMAHSIVASQKTNWEDLNDTGNAGTIGGEADLFAVRIIQINGFDYILYITNYRTFFNGYDANVKFYRIPGGCLPPTDFTITNIVNGTTDTGAIAEVDTVSILTGEITVPATILTAAGVSTANFHWDSITSSVFTSSMGGKRLTYTGSGSIVATLQWTIQGMRHSLVTPFVYQLYKNGAPVSGTTYTLASNMSTFDIHYYWFNTFVLTLAPGDYIEYNVLASLSGSDTNYLLTQTLGNIEITSGDSVNQEFAITGAPQSGGLFTVSIYGTLITAGADFDTTNTILVASLVTQINSANIPVPLGNQPPTIVSASVDPLNDTMFIVSSGSGNNASASYLPASLATVTFTFAEPEDVGISYTIRIINVDLSITTTNSGGPAPRSIPVRRGYNYIFSIRTECENGSSDWSADLPMFIP